jgi:hypothetical protein
MKNATLFVVIIAALVLFAAACGSSRQATTIKSRPKWVMTAEGLALKMLDEHSKPASVSYHRGQKTLTVTLRFSHAVVCTGCPGGGPAIIHGRIVPPPPIRGRIWTITLDPYGVTLRIALRPRKILAFAVWNAVMTYEQLAGCMKSLQHLTFRPESVEPIRG